MFRGCVFGTFLTEASAQAGAPKQAEQHAPQLNDTLALVALDAFVWA